MSNLEIAPIRGVAQNYGTREPGRVAGNIGTSGSLNEMVIHLTGQLLSDGILIKYFLPKDAAFTGQATLIVDEAFDLAASSVVEVGEKGAEATNGISLTEANLESTGVTDVSAALAGEWDEGSKLPHSQEVDIVFSAGSVSDAAVGKATLILEYLKVTATA